MSRPQEQYILGLTLKALTPPELNGSWERYDDGVHPPDYIFSMYTYIRIPEADLLDEETSTEVIRASLLEYADMLDSHATVLYNWAAPADFGEEPLES